MKRFASIALVGAIASLAPSALAFCPSYTASSSNNTRNCAVEAVPGQNPSVAEWQDIFARIAKGPSAWGSDGPSVPTIGKGCGKPEPLHQVEAHFPCELLKAIAMAESSWRQFCVPDRPADQVGGPSRTIISFDCGYGVSQVTSGMRTQDPTPDYDRQRVAGDAVYNLATGARILAQKWKAVQCVGDNQPDIIEHWYSAVWAYNGLAYVNNPANPVHDANRGVYNPNAGGSAPYQEKVFGWIENPPSASHWTSVRLAYPNPGDMGSTGSPPALPEPSCASPTDCVNKRVTHPTACSSDETPDAGAAEPDASDDAGSGAGGSGGSGGAGGTGGGSGTGGNGGTGGTGSSGNGGGGGTSGTDPGDDIDEDFPFPGGGQGGGSRRNKDGGTAEGYTVSCACHVPGERSRGVGGALVLALGLIGLVTRRASSSPR